MGLAIKSMNRTQKMKKKAEATKIAKTGTAKPYGMKTSYKTDIY